MSVEVADAIAASTEATRHNSQYKSQHNNNDSSQRNSTHSNGSRKSKAHVGPWRLGRTLGRGSSGRVRLAKHSTTGKLAAVKIVPKSIVGAMEDPSNKDAGGLPYGIEREVIIMKLIEHPNVMALYDVWENKGELYLVLEYIEGGELFDYLIKKGRLEEREAVNYFRQIIQGVHYCHKFNICHRDLKPENLLLDKNRNIKIADFGMAALETERMLETSCGSPHYASPEIVAGKNYHGGPSDVWSCGIILFALLTGHLPFDDENIRKLLLKVQAGKYQMPEDLSPQAKDLIRRMLQLKPGDRIAVEDILKHPLLKKYPQRQDLWRKLPNETVTHDVTRPCRSRQDIDQEILKNLQTLWHGETRERVIEKLLSPDMNSEKTFYCLLMKYRHDHSQHQQQHHHHQEKPKMQKRPSNAQLNASHKRKSSASVTALKGRHRHTRTASRTSVLTASSSHRRTQPRGKRASRTTTPSSSAQVVTGTAVTTTISPQVRARAKISSPSKPPPKAPPHDKRATIISPPAPPPPPPPQRKRANLKDEPANRTSAEFASLCEEAFGFDRSAAAGSASARAVSDPVDSSTTFIKPVERRATSYTEPTEELQSLDPSIRPYSTATQDGFVLPMIFEEDRFADAIEEEVERVYHNKQPAPYDPRRGLSRQPTKVRAVAPSHHTAVADYNNDDDDYEDITPPGSAVIPEIRVDECSRLEIHDMINSDSFSKSLPPFAAYRTPSPPHVVRFDPTTFATNKTPPPVPPKNREPLATRDVNNKTDKKKDEGGSRSIFKKLSIKRKVSPSSAPPTPELPVMETMPPSPNPNPDRSPPNTDAKQNWFMKMLSGGPREPATPKPKEFKEVVELSKPVYSTMPIIRLRHCIMDVLYDWQKYGITRISEEDSGSMIRAVISPRNVLKARSSRFRIQLHVKRGVSVAVFTKEKGSKQSFIRFVNEMESVLEELKTRDEAYYYHQKAARYQPPQPRTVRAGL